jgi:hypothetical protein
MSGKAAGMAILDFGIEDLGIAYRHKSGDGPQCAVRNGRGDS